MPRVHFVKKARKDNPVAKKGESYYWWKFRYGGKRFSKTMPRQSQLTNSDKLSRLYEAQEMVEDAPSPDIDMSPDALSDLASAIEDAKSQVEEVKDEYQESYDNMEQAFPSGCPNMEMCEEMRDNCETIEDSLDDAHGTLEGLVSEWEDAAQKRDEAQDALDALDEESDPKAYEEAEAKLREAEEECDRIVTEAQDAVDGIDWSF
jgi:uncharacterized protein YukE